MFRRSILEISCRRSVTRIPRRLASQLQTLPSFLCSRKEFSSSPQQNASPNTGSSGKSKSHLPKIVVGSALVAGGGLLAYQSGYLDHYIGEEKQKSVDVGIDHKDVKETQILGAKEVLPVSEEPDKLSHDVKQNSKGVETEKDLPRFDGDQELNTQSDLPHVETKQNDETRGDIPVMEAEEKVESQTNIPPHEALDGMQGEKPSDTRENKGVVNKDGSIDVQEKREPEFSPESTPENGLGLEHSEVKTARETSEAQVMDVPTQMDVVHDENVTKEVPSQQLETEDRSKVAPVKGTEATDLLDAYHLKDSAERSTTTEGTGEEGYVSATEEPSEGYITKDGKLVIGILEAIHAAEKRQAELDARASAEEKRELKEKFEKELRDLRARELMRAEEAAMLDKEIKRERAKAAAAIRTLQEKMEEKLRTELEKKESEMETNINKLKELAKAELAAAIASEKASQIEKMAEANLNINALCMAFYARSEEVHQIHSLNKLAVGALALEDALSRGLPIQRELDALNTHLESIDKDSLIYLVLSTLPEETRYHGTETPLQLKRKFNSLKGTLRHYVLISPGTDSGILVHAMAQIASWLRFKEVDPSGDGIESVISRVENFLAEGKLAEAANALQDGLRDTEAEKLAGDWVRHARNRAITEQALTVLQSYAASISLMH